MFVVRALGSIEKGALKDLIIIIIITIIIFIIVILIIGYSQRGIETRKLLILGPMPKPLGSTSPLDSTPAHAKKSQTIFPKHTNVHGDRD